MDNNITRIFFAIRKSLIILITVVLLTSNVASAFDSINANTQNHFKIVTASNKCIEINLSTIDINEDIVTLSTKFFNDNLYKIRVSINVKEKTVKKIKQEIYDKNNNLLNVVEYPKTDTFKTIKDGTLMSEIYEIAVILKNSEESFTKNSKDWDIYFSNVLNNIYTAYNPNMYKLKSRVFGKAIDIVMMLDKDGNILSYQYKDLMRDEEYYSTFDIKYKERIEKVLKNHNTFPPLPKEYSGKKVIILFYIRFDDKTSYKHFFTKNGVGILILEKEMKRKKYIKF